MINCQPRVCQEAIQCPRLQIVCARPSRGGVSWRLLTARAKDVSHTPKCGASRSPFCALDHGMSVLHYTKGPQHRVDRAPLQLAVYSFLSLTPATASIVHFGEQLRLSLPAVTFLLYLTINEHHILTRLLHVSL